MNALKSVARTQRVNSTHFFQVTYLATLLNPCTSIWRKVRGTMRELMTN